MTVTTTVMAVDPSNPDQTVIKEAYHVLVEGGLVAFPTDTLYALGADALEERAVKRVFLAKGREPEKPITVLIADLEMATSIVEAIPPLTRKLSARFWPGPLTLVLQARPLLPPLLNARTGRIGIRVPGLPLAVVLIQRMGRPLTGTSANLSGGQDPRTAQDVLRDLQGRIDLILDGGPVPLGVPSTVLDLVGESPSLIREGAIKKGELEAVGVFF